jgi:hypothetical protein
LDFGGIRVSRRLQFRTPWRNGQFVRRKHLGLVVQFYSELLHEESLEHNREITFARVGRHSSREHVELSTVPRNPAGARYVLWSYIECRRHKIQQPSFLPRHASRRAGSWSAPHASIAWSSLIKLDRGRVELGFLRAPKDWEGHADNDRDCRYFGFHRQFTNLADSCI